MKRYAVLLLALGFLASGVDAQSRTRSYTDKVSGGALTITNNAEEGSAFELKRVEFKIPVAAFTNAFSIVQSRKFQLPDVKAVVVTTNTITRLDGTPWIETNTIYRTGGSATFAYTNVIATSTNVVAPQVYDLDDFGRGYTFEEEDVTTFGFTYTNDFYLIRVYDVYSRP